MKLHTRTDSKKLAQIADLAMMHQDSDQAILAYLRTVDEAIKIREKLEEAKLQVEVLAGTLRAQPSAAPLKLGGVFLEQRLGR